jgi:ribA/ribD-fused uncharacterized protein
MSDPIAKPAMKRKAAAGPADGEETTTRPDDVLFTSKAQDPGWRTLSNFHVERFAHAGSEYLHAEGAFQAKKADLAERVWRELGDGAAADASRELAARIRAEARPSQCKKLGGRANLKMPEEALRRWNGGESLEAMRAILRDKFGPPESLARAALVATGDRRLFEARSVFPDKYWGVHHNAKTGVLRGENRLGRLLTEIRTGLRPAPPCPKSPGAGDA